MSLFNPNTGDSAEDKMSEAAGCISFAVIAVILIVLGMLAFGAIELWKAFLR
jgi:hypothetical protein